MPNETKKNRSLEDEALLAGLNQHPEIKERVRAILAMAEGREGVPMTVDELESLLVEEVRQLGRQTMGDWAQAQAVRVEQQVRAEHPKIHRSKKNA